VLDSADILKEGVDNEQDDKSKERHHTDDCTEAARVTITIVAAAVFVPALVWDAAEHDHREQLQTNQQHPTSTSPTNDIAKIAKTELKYKRNH